MSGPIIRRQEHCLISSGHAVVNVVEDLAIVSVSGPKISEGPCARWQMTAADLRAVGTLFLELASIMEPEQPEAAA